MALAFVACSPLSILNDDQSAQEISVDDLEGLWESKVQLSDMLTSVDEETLTDSASDSVKNVLEVIQSSSADVDFSIYLDFSDDSYDVYFEISEYCTAVKEFYFQLFDELSEDKKTLAKFMSLTEEELDAFLDAQSMTSLSEITDLLKTNVENMSDSDMEGLISPSNGSGEIKNGKFIIESLDFEIDGKKIILQEDVGSESTVIMKFKSGKLVFDRFTEEGVSANAYIFKNGFEKAE